MTITSLLLKLLETGCRHVNTFIAQSSKVFCLEGQMNREVDRRESHLLTDLDIRRAG